MSKLITVTELAKSLNLINSVNNKPQTYVLRYWEKEFNIIKPRIINKRRYYTSNQVQIIKMIKFLLKTKGMTISGVKKLLRENVNKLDDHNSHSLQAEYYKNSLKTKSKLIIDKINRIKNYGKKNTS